LGIDAAADARRWSASGISGAFLASRMFDRIAKPMGKGIISGVANRLPSLSTTSKRCQTNTRRKKPFYKNDVKVKLKN
jgi:hypothetical protein